MSLNYKLDNIRKKELLTCVYIGPAVTVKSVYADVLGKKNHVANPAIVQRVARNPIWMTLRIR